MQSDLCDLRDIEYFVILFCFIPQRSIHVIPVTLSVVFRHIGNAAGEVAQKARVTSDSSVFGTVRQIGI